MSPEDVRHRAESKGHTHTHTHTGRFHANGARGVAHVLERESKMVVSRACREGSVGGGCLVGTEFRSGRMKRTFAVGGGSGTDQETVRYDPPSCKWLRW